MRAIVYQGAGGVEVIGMRDVPMPALRPKHVLVHVKAAGLNRADLIQRRGHYAAPPGWPADIPGLEYVGVVEELGAGVGRWRVGTRVMGLVGGGAHAEYVVVHEDEAMPVPPRLADDLAAAIPEAWVTAFDALITRGRLRSGERLLVHAIGSGVGTAAVQLAKWLGATVIGTSRTAAKIERALALGADQGIDTSGRPFREAITQPVDVILDFFGGPALADNLSLLAPKGRLVLLGTLQGGTAPQVDVGRLLRSRLEVIGTVMRARSLEERIPLVREFTEWVLPHFGDGSLPSFSAIVGATYPMSEIADAHAAMEADRVFGKIVLTW
jgi:putative PIG3 family NAD(P)H quinone oxidoreductase